MMHARHAQATIEAALVIPILVLITLSFFALQIRLEAQSEMDAAVSLAAAAAAEAPAGSTQSNVNANRTFNDTIKQYSYFTAVSLTGCGAHAVGSTTPISCTGKATITWIKVPMISFAVNLVSVSATYSAVPSNHRTQCGYVGAPC
jgi:mannitol-specific phosphotransferase system IIBC component